MTAMYIGHACALVAASTFYYHYKREQKKIDSTLPPKAPGYWPVIGHLLQALRPISIDKLFYEWSKQVGPIYTCYFGSQKWIVLNTMKPVQDLIVERGSIYSSRIIPDTLVHDFFQGDQGGGFSFFPYGKPWRDLRRITHGGLTKTKIDNYQPIINDRRTFFLSYLFKLSQESPTGVSILQAIEHYAMTGVLTIAFGDMCSFEPGDPDLHEAFALTENLVSSMSPSDQIPEFFPILKSFWPVKTKKYLALRDDFDRFYSKIFLAFNESFKKDPDNVQDCFVKDILLNENISDLKIKHIIGVFVGAGSDTTASTLEWLVAFLANEQEVQEKAYNEIVDVVGNDRLPESYDESSLPYLSCIILETLRMRPAAPISIPHATSEKDIYQDWVIPKDTIIIMNLFAINHDPERYEDPHTFKPERHMPFLDKDSQADAPNSRQSKENPRHLSFSAGRRACVGLHLAERSLFMAASMLIACFKIVRTTEALIDVESSRDIRIPTLAPVPYHIRLVPRHDKVKTFF